MSFSIKDVICGCGWLFGLIRFSMFEVEGHMGKATLPYCCSGEVYQALERSMGSELESSCDMEGELS